MYVAISGGRSVFSLVLQGSDGWSFMSRTHIHLFYIHYLNSRQSHKDIRYNWYLHSELIIKADLPISFPFSKHKTLLQVTTLVNQKGPSSKKKGRSKKGHVLAAAVQRATQNFVERGEEIALENPDVKEDMLIAVEEVRKTGNYEYDSKLQHT